MTLRLPVYRPNAIPRVPDLYTLERYCGDAETAARIRAAMEARK